MLRSLALSMSFSVAAALHGQQWVQLPDFPGTARDDAAVFSLNDKIYVGTGLAVGWVLTNDWWCYDTQLESWSEIAPLPATARQYGAAFTVHDTGYLFGGIDANGALNELWAYYPEQDMWIQKASLPAEARYACAAVEGFDYGIVATGMLQSGVPTNEAWKYHPAVDEWESMNPVPGPARHRAAAFLDGGGMLIVGGADANFDPLSDAWSYPVWFETGEYYQRPDLPAPRYGADGGSNYTMVVACGASETNTFHSEVWNYTGNAWIPLPEFAGGLRRGGVGAGIESQQWWTYRFYYGLGLTGDLVRRNDWWQLDVVLGIDNPVESRIGIVPNPASTTIMICIPEAWASTRVDLMDALGRTVSTEVIGRNGFIDVTGLAPGRYAVSVLREGSHLRGAFIKLP